MFHFYNPRNRVSTGAGKAGKAGKMLIFCKWDGKAGKASIFQLVGLEKLENIF